MNTELLKIKKSAELAKLSGFFSTLRSGLRGRVSNVPAGIHNPLSTESLWSVFSKAVKDTDPILAKDTWKAMGSGVATGAKTVGSGAAAVAKAPVRAVKALASHDEVVAIDKLIKNREMLAEQFRRLPANSTAAKSLQNQINALDNNIFTFRQQLGGITDRLTFGSRANAPTSANEAWQYGGLGNRAERVISGGPRPRSTSSSQVLPQSAPTPAAASKPSMWEQYQGAFNKNPLAVGGLTAGGFMLANNALKGGNGAGGNRTVIL